MGSLSGGLEHLLNGFDHTVEIVALGGELFTAGGCERVIAGAPIVLRRSPFGSHPTVQEESLERWVERAFADLEDVVGGLLELQGDAIAVHGAFGEGFEDQ